MKTQGMSWLMKTGLVLLLTLASTVFLGEGWLLPSAAQAAVTRLDIWPAAPQITNVTTTVSTGTFSPSAGANRLVIVSVQAHTNATTATTITGTFGGTTTRALRPIVNSPNNQRRQAWLFYLNEADLAAVNGTTITINNNVPGSGYNVYASTYAGVDQTTPITATDNLYNNNAGLTNLVTLNANANGMAIYADTHSLNEDPTNNGGFTGYARDTVGAAYSYAADVVTSGNINPTFSFSAGTLYCGWAACSLNPVVATNGTLAVSAATQNVSEAAGNATISVTRTGGTSGAVAVSYTTANGTAYAGSDYTTTSGTLNWADGDATAKTITVPILNDGYDELSETFTVTLSTPTGGATLGTATQTVTITDDDTTPTIGFTSGSSTGNNTTSPAVFTVTLSAASGLATSVNYATTAGTAVAGTDYTTSSGTVNIPALSTTGTINIPILSAGSGGTFTITLSAPTNATLGTNPHVYTITAGLASTLTSCASCHSYTTTFNDSASRDNSAGTFPGSHNGHVVGSGMSCAACHVAPADTTSANFKHANGTVQIAAAISGGTYSKASFDTVNSFSPSTCTNTACHGTASPAWGSNTTNATCTKCHGVSGTTPAQYTADNKTAAPGYLGTGKDTGGSAAATDAQVGAHDTHLRSSNNYSTDVACNTCHKNINTTSTTFTGHMNGSGTVVFFGLATTNHAIPTYTGGSCSATYCHFGKPNNVAYTAGAAVAWNATTYLGGTTADCQKCHASPPSATGVHASQAFPGSCNTCHTHISTLGVITDPTKHINGIVESNSHNFPYAGSIHKSLAIPLTNCTGCHTNVSGTYPVTRPAKPDCRSCHVKASPGTGCNTCHGRSTTGGVALNYSAARPNGGISGGFPNYSGSHTTHVIKAGLACTGCHNGYGSGSDKHGFSNTSGATYSRTNFKKMAFTVGGSPTYTRATMTCSTLSCHGTAVWGGRLTCLNCHNTAVTRTVGTYAGKTLGAVTAEFGLAYGHKKTGRVAVTAADCVVCHLEGVGGSTSTSATYHKNGTIDLRDPDIQGETPITNLTNGAFTFGRFSTSFATGSRSASPAANDIAQVISIKFCLKCHDANGAQNTTARAGGTANMPWGGSTGYAAQTSTTLNGVPVANGTTNVFSQFSSGNSSVHPVRAPRTKDFPTPARMVAPYNGFTRVGTAGTVTQGVVINCFDCHNNYPTLNYLGKTGLLTLRTNAAHGTNGAAASGGMMRGTFYTATATLCSSCHSGYTVTGQHGAGSAMASNTGRTDEGFNNQCSNCHGSKTTAPTTAPARPIPAADYHGFNNRYTGVLWPTINARPVAFIRGWSGTAYHRGRGLAGTSGYAVGTAQCGTGTCPTGGSVGDGGNRNYIPGGTY